LVIKEEATYEKKQYLQNKIPLKKRKVEIMAKNKPHYLPSGKLYKGLTHKDSKGKLMTGAKHTAASKFLTHKPKKK
tara:strand:+ start:13254 stop:13481 length:228 start_codon:yes stop_codon:yes gene_type:complete